MNLQVFDVDSIETFDWEVDEKGKPTGKVVPCNNPSCSRGHLFSLYKEGKWQGRPLSDFVPYMA